MNVYVAGRFTNKTGVRAAQQALRDADHFITYDWTREDVGGLLSEARLRVLTAGAQNDLDGVLCADAILVLHDDTGRGLFVELGAALADRNKLIVVVDGLRGAHPSGCVFYFHPRVRHFETVAGAVRFITEAGR